MSPVPRVRCPLCGWTPRKDDRWGGVAATFGTRSTSGEFAPAASTSGNRPSACPAPGGRRIRIGMRSKELHSPGWILQRGDALPATGVGGLGGLLEPKIRVVPPVLSLVLCPPPHKGSD